MSSGKIPLLVESKAAPDELDEELATLCRALSHPIRVRIVRLLIQLNACVCGELVDLLPVAQSTVSQHLKILKDAGIVQGDIDGPKVCYCIHSPTLDRVKILIKGL